MEQVSSFMVEKLNCGVSYLVAFASYRITTLFYEVFAYFSGKCCALIASCIAKYVFRTMFLKVLVFEAFLNT